MLSIDSIARDNSGCFGIVFGTKIISYNIYGWHMGNFSEISIEVSY